jgi:hypothetical protein
MVDRLYFRWIVLFALIIGTLLSASLFLSRSAQAQGLNLLTNPGFETGTTSGWSVNFSTATFSVVTTTVHAGSYAASLTSNSNSIKFISQTVTGIVPGSSYSFSGYGYINDANTQRIYLRLAWYPTTDCSGGQLSTTFDTNAVTTVGSYQPLTATARIAPATAACARIRASLDPVTATAATAFFDDLSFTLDPTPTPTFTPMSTQTSTPAPPAEKLLITEVLYNGTQTDEGDEFIEMK